MKVPSGLSPELSVTWQVTVTDVVFGQNNVFLSSSAVLAVTSA